jgi:c-di-GMP-binding flagellar brake protein YcgR
VRQAVEAILGERLKLDELQSYGDLLPSEQATPRPEQRQSQRKALTIAARFVVDGMPLDVVTIDVSAGGASVESAIQLAVGKDGRLSFDLDAAGTTICVATDAAVIYCFYTGEQGYKVGLEFLGLDPAAREHIERYTRT